MGNLLPARPYLDDDNVHSEGSNMHMRAAGFLAIVFASLSFSGVTAQENYERWELLKTEFPSTGGGGIIIGE